MIAPLSGRLAVAPDDDHPRVVLVGDRDQRVVRVLVDHLDLAVDAGGLRCVDAPRAVTFSPSSSTASRCSGTSPPP